MSPKTKDFNLYLVKTLIAILLGFGLAFVISRYSDSLLSYGVNNSVYWHKEKLEFEAYSTQSPTDIFLASLPLAIGLLLIPTLIIFGIISKNKNAYLYVTEVLVAVILIVSGYMSLSAKLSDFFVIDEKSYYKTEDGDLDKIQMIKKADLELIELIDNDGLAVYLSDDDTKISLFLGEHRGLDKKVVLTILDDAITHLVPIKTDALSGDNADLIETAQDIKKYKAAFTRDLIKKNNKSQEVSEREKYFEFAKIDNSSDASKIASELLFYRGYGINLKSSDPSKTWYINTANNFSLHYPSDWSFFPNKGNKPVFVSPGTIVRNGLYDLDKDFVFSVMLDCDAEFRNVHPPYSNNDDLDDFIAVYNKSEERRAPKKLVSGPEKVSPFKGLPEATLYRWVWEQNPGNRRDQFRYPGDFRMDDYFIEINDARFLISFEYYDFVKDQHWNKAVQAVETLVSSGVSCNTEREIFGKDHAVDYFYPKGGYLSVSEYIDRHSLEETIEFMQKRVEQERVERSAKYTPPKPVRKPIFDPEFGFACPPPGPDGVFYCIIP